jgi:hypothetical protein
MEFPLYQWIVAAWVELTGMPLDQAGRTISVLGYLISLWLVYLCLEHWRMSRPLRLVFLTLILTSPIYLFWSRTFMIESLALCFCLAYVLFASRFIREPRWVSIAAAGFFGCLAGLTKATTFFAFALAVALLLARLILSPNGQPLVARARAYLARAAGILVACALLPLAVVLAWTRHADSLKAQVPFANFITSAALERWNFGTWEQRVSSKFWQEITLGRIIPDTFGSLLMPTIVGLLFASSLIWLKGRRLAVAFSLLLFLAAHLTFTNLHLVHNYYQYANAIFLLVAAGFGIVALIESEREPLIAHGALALVLLVGSGIHGYHQRFAGAALHNRDVPPIVDAIREHTPQEGVVLIYGADWSSEIPYYAERRAIMDIVFRPLENAVMQQTLALLGERTLEGVVSCGMRSRNPEGLTERLAGLGFAGTPVETAGQCELYLPLPRSTPLPDSLARAGAS